MCIACAAHGSVWLVMREAFPGMLAALQVQGLAPGQGSFWQRLYAMTAQLVYPPGASSCMQMSCSGAGVQTHPRGTLQLLQPSGKQYVYPTCQCRDCTARHP